MLGGSFRERWFGWFALDPNPRFKLAHLFAGAAVGLGVRLYPGCNHDWLNVLVVVALIGAAYELLETWDAGHGSYGANKLGTAGYGFSWRDIVTDGAGAIALGLAAAILRILTGVVLLGVLLVAWQPAAAAQAAHYGHHGVTLLPDPQFTPGKVATTDTGLICHRSTKQVRHTRESLKAHIRREYGVAAHPKVGTEEVDHDVPLELGGADDSLNLWAQPARPVPGFHEKDRLENFLHAQVCTGRMSITDAQAAIRGDWVPAYLRMLGP